jgi:hypothetical protein
MRWWARPRAAPDFASKLLVSDLCEIGFLQLQLRHLGVLLYMSPSCPFPLAENYASAPRDPIAIRPSY